LVLVLFLIRFCSHCTN